MSVRMCREKCVPDVSRVMRESNASAKAAYESEREREIEVEGKRKRKRDWSREM